MRPPGASPPGSGDRGAPPPPSGAAAYDESAAQQDLSEQERAQLAGELDELRHQLLDTPVEIVVANHVYGLFELAAIHLSQQPPSLEPAQLAIDAMAALVEGLAGRLGEPEASLRDALNQIRLAFVQLSKEGAPGVGAAGSDGGTGTTP